MLPTLRGLNSKDTNTLQTSIHIVTEKVPSVNIGGAFLFKLTYLHLIFW